MAKPYRITIFGTGGVGGFLAARIFQAFSGHDEVSLACIARGAHLEAIQQRGLLFTGIDNQKMTVHPDVCTDNPADLPDTDLWIICTKGYDLDDVSKAIEPCIKNDTVILPLLNGADIQRRMRKYITEGIILPGCIYISSAVTGPGEVRHIGGEGAVTAGYDSMRRDFDPQFICSVFQQSGIPLTWLDDPLPAVWTKYLFISPLSLVTAAKNKSFGEVLEDSQLVKDIKSIMGEIISLARTQGVEIEEANIEASIQQASSFPPETKTSFQRDIESSSDRDEREILGGAIIRMADEQGIEVPVTTKYYLSLP